MIVLCFGELHTLLSLRFSLSRTGFSKFRMLSFLYFSKKESIRRVHVIVNNMNRNYHTTYRTPSNAQKKSTCDGANQARGPNLGSGSKGIYTSQDYKNQLSALEAPHVHQLSRAVMDRKWMEAINIINREPHQTRKRIPVQSFMNSSEMSDLLPIHLALSDPKVPIEVIRSLIEAYPESIFKVETGYCRNCIHIALRGLVPETLISYIIQLFPEACKVQDRLGRLPLHYAIYNGHSISLIHELLNVYPQAIKSYDNLWWSPLHVACQSRSSPKLILFLLNLSPETILMTTKMGNTPLDIARGCGSDIHQRGAIISILQKADEALRDIPLMRNYRDAVSNSAHKYPSSYSYRGEIHYVV